MRILTRGDMDGMTASLLLTLVEDVREIHFAHPKDVQDGLVEADEQDIVVNLPHIPGCGMWFDHHVSEGNRLDEIGEFKGRFEVVDSAARVIYNHYTDAQETFDKFADLLEATDKLDAAKLSPEEVANPEGWLLLGLTLDPRTGLGPEFRKYFRWLVEFIKEVPLEKVLAHNEVGKRVAQVQEDQRTFKRFLAERSRLEDTVIVTDLRGIEGEVPIGNRFLVYSLFPEGNVEARIFAGKGGTTVVALGHSIFNRTCNVNIGQLCARYGGGGHQGAGTCQLESDRAGEQINEILGILKANEALTETAAS